LKKALQFFHDLPARDQALPVAVDSSFSIDTISEMLIMRSSLVATPSLRSEFEQQLCVQLLSLSELVEILVDRVLELEERLQLVEGQHLEASTGFESAEQAGELLSASELKVRSLRNRLTPSTVVPLKPEDVVEERIEDQITGDHPYEDQTIVDQRVEQVLQSAEAPIEAASDSEMEYVDDPQIDLLSA
jgi:hypothetical protein